MEVRCTPGLGGGAVNGLNPLLESCAWFYELEFHAYRGAIVEEREDRSGAVAESRGHEGHGGTAEGEDPVPALDLRFDAGLHGIVVVARRLVERTDVTDANLGGVGTCFANLRPD